MVERTGLDDPLAPPGARLVSEAMIDIALGGFLLRRISPKANFQTDSLAPSRPQRRRLDRLDDLEALEFGMAEIERSIFAGVAVREPKCV